MRQATAIKLKRSDMPSLVAEAVFVPGRILSAILTAFAVLVACYIFVVGSIILNIVERRALEAEAKALQSEVGEMELKYLSVYQEFDFKLSRELGFVEAKPNFAARAPLGSLPGLGTVGKLVKNEI